MLLAFDFGVAGELASFRVQEDRVIRDTGSLRTFSNSGQIGLWRFSYSSLALGLTDMTKALRIFMLL